MEAIVYGVEVWKPIPGYEGLYEASSHGRFRRMWETDGPVIRCQSIDQKGYARIILSKDRKHTNYLSARVVALTFIGEPTEGQEVNHKNGIKADNRVENLEWVSHAENIRHAHEVLNVRGLKRTAPAPALFAECELVGVNQVAKMVGMAHHQARKNILLGRFGELEFHRFRVHVRRTAVLSFLAAEAESATAGGDTCKQ